MKRILKGELIGLSVKVIDSKNKANKGLQGTIVNETKNTITIHADKKKILIKDQNEFEIDKIRIKGTLLVGRPEERIKKIR